MQLTGAADVSATGFSAVEESGTTFETSAGSVVLVGAEVVASGTVGVLRAAAVDGSFVAMITRGGGFNGKNLFQDGATPDRRGSNAECGRMGQRRKVVGKFVGRKRQ